MTDLEMTRLCAEAMEWIVWTDAGDQVWNVSTRYDPLHDRAQAFELVEKLYLSIGTMDDLRARYAGPVRGDRVYGDDLCRAIVECVAKMQAAKDRAKASAK